MSDAAATPATPVRYHGLDALRAGAMALGVVLHAAAPYLRHPMEGLVWAVDGPPGGTPGFPWADAVFWWLHAWRVPLFFVLAGFFAAMLVERRGVGAFLRHRAERVLWPLCLACVVVLPATYFAFAWGWTTTGVATWSEVFRISFGKGLVKDEVLGPAHLWFLVYLYLFCVLYAAAATVMPRRGRARGAAAWMSGAAWWCWITPLVLGVLVAAHPHVAVSFENDFVPRPYEFVYQGWYFAWGVAVYHGRGVLAPIAARCRVLTAMAVVAGVVATVVALPYLAGHAAAAGPGKSTTQPVSRAVFGVTWAVCAWLTILAFLAAAVRWLGRPRPAVEGRLRWLSDSAYWVYLTHVPLVAVVHVALDGSAVPVSVRFGLAVGVPLAATLLSYRYGVRYTRVGAWLHGRRGRPAAPVSPPEPNR